MVIINDRPLGIFTLLNLALFEKSLDTAALHSCLHLYQTLPGVLSCRGWVAESRQGSAPWCGLLLHIHRWLGRSCSPICPKQLVTVPFLFSGGWVSSTESKLLLSQKGGLQQGGIPMSVEDWLQCWSLVSSQDVCRGGTWLRKLLLDSRSGGWHPWRRWSSSLTAFVISNRLATSCLMSAGTMSARRCRLFVLVGFKQPVIQRQVLFNI